jgi:hypothetical protein
VRGLLVPPACPARVPALSAAGFVLPVSVAVFVLPASVAGFFIPLSAAAVRVPPATVVLAPPAEVPGPVVDPAGTCGGSGLRGVKVSAEMVICVPVPASRTSPGFSVGWGSLVFPSIRLSFTPDSWCSPGERHPASPIAASTARGAIPIRAIAASLRVRAARIRAAPGRAGRNIRARRVAAA